MVNPAQPLRGYSPIISREDLPLGPRSRFALQRLNRPGKISAQDLHHMVMDDKVYLAELALPDLLQWCKGATADPQLKAVCDSLAAWDGKAGLASGIGLVHFQNILQALQEHGEFWRVAFDPADPQHTPRGLALERAEVARAVRAAALASQAQVAEAGLSANVQWGQIQQAGDGTPMHGGPSSLGVYNAMQSVPGEAYMPASCQ